MTTFASVPMTDIQKTVTAAGRGPALLQDVWFREKLACFDREVIPERRMHAKRSGAIGAFTITQDITPLHHGQALSRSRKAGGDVS